MAAGISPPRILGRSHHHVTGDRPHMRHRAQGIGVKRLVGRQVSDLDPQDVFERTRHIVAFGDFISPLHGPFEPVLGVLGMFGQPDGDVDNIGPPGLRRVQPRAVTFDDAGSFQFLNTPQAGRG